MVPAFFSSLAINLTARLALMVAALACLCAPAKAAADLLIAPTRVVFQGAQRAAEIALVNRGKERATFRIGIVNKRMDRDGRFVDIDTPGENERFADGMLRLSQREISLEPGQPQTIRVILRKPEALADGEYRSHLLFRGVPAPSAPSASGSGAPGLSIALTPIYGVSIPVIVRQGPVEAMVKILGASVEAASAAGPATLVVTLERQGERSVHGDLTVAPTGKPDEPAVAQIRGVSVYTPNSERVVRIALDARQAKRIAEGGLTLTFRETDPGGAAVVAERPL